MLDSIIHQPVRLRIMSVLVDLAPGDEVDFVHLKKVLSLTDGNLGAHLLKLEQAGYIKVNKMFVDRKPRTYVQVSGVGRDAYGAHVQALRSIIEFGGNGKR
ncbi:MAG: transcriptional regulator [Pontiellaceae bacterium]|nr:transcriptional regulator [Pontiellaceae bacterium]MBN2783888.1 transcriptional regulator [Pontiellaceae bacterium]